MIEVMSKEYANFNITFNTLKLGNFNFGLYKLLKKEVKEEILKKVGNVDKVELSIMDNIDIF